GRGSGRYYSATDSDNIYFDVIANVDFATREVSLTGTNTCNQSIAFACAFVDSQYYHYNFTGELSYDAGTNSISGYIATKGDTSNTKLSGTADARFYGNGAGKASEIGGTFSMSNADSGYVGWFGAQKD
nr:hypothetical protein [Alphaproteobacteria bacterium]